jgi:copper chaperone CopZ
MNTSTYFVDGMTCAHCIGAVTREVSALPHVSDVSIDLASGAVTVSSTHALADDAVEGAVEEAGYAMRRPDQRSMAAH